MFITLPRKKHLWITLIAVMTVLVVAMSVWALATVTHVETNTIISAESKNVTASENFDVKFNFKDNSTKIEGGKFVLTYDANKLTANSVTKSQSLGTGATIDDSESETGRYVVTWINSTIDATDTEGELFAVNFTAAETFTEGSYTEIGVAVEGFGYTGDNTDTYMQEGFTVENAMVYNGNSFTYEIGDDFAAEMADMVKISKSTAVTYTLNADVAVEESATFGTEASSYPNAVTITASETKNISLGKVSDTEAVPFTFNGNFVFDGVNIVSNTTGVLDPYSNRPMMFFPNGSKAVFNNTVTTAIGDGSTEAAYPAVAGADITVNGGSWAVVCGNSRGTNATVESPTVTIGGSATTTCFVGGSYNGLSGNGDVTGTVTGNISGAASVANYAVGNSWCADSVSSSVSSSLTINTTSTTKISHAIAGNRGSTTKETLTEDTPVKNTLELKNGTVSYIYSWKSDSTNQTSYINTKLTVSGGTASNIYGASYQPQEGATINGRVYVNVTGGTVTTLYGGSNLNKKNSTSAAEAIISLTGGSLGGSVYGGSCLDQDNTVHSGKTTITFNGSTNSGSYHYGGSNFNVYSGHNDCKNSDHSGESLIYINGSAVGSAYWGGSMLRGSNVGNKHSGNSKIVFETTSGEYTGILCGGSRLLASGMNHTGSASLIINSGTINATETRIVGGVDAAASSSNFGMNGDSLLQINGGSVTAKYIVGGSYFLAGCKGTMNGNSTLEINGGTVNGSTILSAGSTLPSAQTVDYTTETSVYGSSVTNINAHRQTGDITFTATGGTVNSNVFLAGKFSNVDGNVYANIYNGTVNNQTTVPTINGSIRALDGNQFISGDVVVKISGGTIKNNIVLGGNGKSGDTINSAIGGNNIIEISGGTFADGTAYKYTNAPTTDNLYIDVCVGGYSGVVCGKSVLKLVGNGPSVNSTTNKVALRAFSSAYKANQTLDLLQYTGSNDKIYFSNVNAASPSTTSYGNFGTVIKPMNGKDVILTSTEVENGTLLSTLIGTNVTIDGTEYSYESITGFDSYTSYPNAFKFYTGKEITNAGTATTSVTVGAGSVRSNAIALTNSSASAVETMINDNYAFVGSSMRATNLAFRCRAKISDTFIANYTAYSENDGFRLVEFGILASKAAQSSTATPFVAWKDGEIKTTNGNFMTKAGDEGYSYFAAAITGYPDTAVAYETNFYFRAYATYVDANEDTQTVYIDLPTESAFATIENNEYIASLADRAKYAYDNELSNATPAMENAITTICTKIGYLNDEE